MPRQTIADRIISERQGQGQVLLGRTSGLYSFRKGSNLAYKLDELGLTEDKVDVRIAARAGRHANDGWQLLIFSLPPTAINAPADLSAEDLVYWANRVSELAPGEVVQIASASA